METTKTGTNVTYTSTPAQETRVTIEPSANAALTDEDKAVKYGAVAAVGGLMGCLTCCTLFILLLALAIPILKLYLGHRYKDECPVQPKIPYFLYVAGIAGIIATLFPIVAAVLALIEVMKSGGPGEGKSTPDTPSTLSRILGIISILINIFLFIWLICGALWTFGVYNRVNYDPKDRLNYCHRRLYLFTIILLILSFVQAIGQCCCGGLRTRR